MVNLSDLPIRDDLRGLTPYGAPQKAVRVALNGGGATATSSSGAALEEITLQAGQSLWQLAEEIAPHDDPRDVISDIMAVNQLESGSVQAGQRLMLPSEYSAE